MIRKYCYVDAEYFNSSEPVLNPVCVAFEYGKDRDSYWLHEREKMQNAVAQDLERLAAEGYVFVSWNVIAEGRFFESIGLDPTDFTWIDLYLEYRHLLNQNWDLQYGKQLIGGKIIMTHPPKPKYKRTEEDKNSPKAEYNLGAATFKLLGIEIDNERKTRIRDIIISKDAEQIEINRDAIMEYCVSDIEHLKKIFVAIVNWYKKLLPKHELEKLFDEMVFRGEFSARTAKMESVGIPFNVEQTKSLADSIPYILKSIQEEINELFPSVGAYRWNKKENRYSQNQGNIKNWIANCPFADNWAKTKSKDFSLAEDAWTQHFHYKYTYPKDSFGAQMIRIIKTNSSLRGFKEKIEGSDKKNFWDSVGSDGRSRPFMNIFGSQTGRSQPGSTGFLFLKSVWIRALAEPPSGWGYGAGDFKSQEFLIAGLESGDMNMINAYMSGDVYMWFAIRAGAAPEGATKKTHEFIRERFKSTVLAMIFRMRAKSLAIKLTQDTGVFHSEDQAQDLIDLFDKIFYVFADWCDEIVEQYDTDGYLKLRDGWYMWGDNINPNSIINYKIQGGGGAILRYTVRRGQQAKLILPQTLHDAAYNLFPMTEEGLESVVTLEKCMKEGFRDYYRGHKLEKYANVQVETKVWGPEFEDGYVTTKSGIKIPSQKVYIDARGKEEFKNFKHYFHRNEELELL